MNHSQTLRLLFLAVTIGAVLAGCASTGFHQPGVTLEQGRQVRFDSPADLYFQRYQPKLTAVLEKHGLQITTNDLAGVLVCKADFKGGVSIRAHVSLWDGQKMLVSGEAFNGGWGTMLASAAAMDGVITVQSRRWTWSFPVCKARCLNRMVPKLLNDCPLCCARSTLTKMAR